MCFGLTLLLAPRAAGPGILVCVPWQVMGEDKECPGSRSGSLQGRAVWRQHPGQRRDGEVHELRAHTEAHQEWESDAEA